MSPSRPVLRAMDHEVAMFLWGACTHEQRQALGWGAITDVEATLQVPRYKHFAELQSFFVGQAGCLLKLPSLGCGVHGSTTSWTRPMT